MAFVPAATERGYPRNTGARPATLTVPDSEADVYPDVKLASLHAWLACSVENEAMSIEPQLSNKHVLYLDDDETLVFLVCRLLTRKGYTVTGLTDQTEAIEAVRSRPQAYNLFLTDYNMPGMSGLDVARAVMAINPALPVAVTSGYITDELQTDALAVGVREIVFKTDAVEEFCAVVARLVQQSSVGS